MAIFGEILSNSQRNHDDDGTKASQVWCLKLAAAHPRRSSSATSVFFNYILSVTRVGAGHVGVEVVLSGSQRGASEIPIRTGWVFYSHPSGLRSSSSPPMCKPSNGRTI